MPYLSSNGRLKVRKAPQLLQSELTVPLSQPSTRCHVRAGRRTTVTARHARWWIWWRSAAAAGTIQMILLAFGLGLQDLLPDHFMYIRQNWGKRVQLRSLHGIFFRVRRWSHSSSDIEVRPPGAIISLAKVNDELLSNL
jgi:hypothetical protein